jgi:hypothetical protein
MGSCAPCRAGGWSRNQRLHSSFIPAKSDSSSRMKVACTTLSIELPAAVRIASTFLRHWRVCSWIVSPTTSPVAGSKGSLTRDEDEAVGPHGLAVPGETFRGVVGADDLLRHRARHYRAPTTVRSLRPGLRRKHPGAPQQPRPDARAGRMGYAHLLFGCVHVRAKCIPTLPRLWTIVWVEASPNAAWTDWLPPESGARPRRADDSQAARRFALLRLFSDVDTRGPPAPVGGSRMSRRSRAFRGCGARASRRSWGSGRASCRCRRWSAPRP